MMRFHGIERKDKLTRYLTVSFEDIRRDWSTQILLHKAWKDVPCRSYCGRAEECNADVHQQLR